MTTTTRPTLSPTAKTLLLAACKQAGSYDPDRVLSFIVEHLTRDEAETVRDFLEYVQLAGKGFGYRTIDERFAEFTAHLRLLPATDRRPTVADVANDIRSQYDAGIPFVALHSHFLLAAKVNGDRWSCFGGIVPGKVFEGEVREVLLFGMRQREEIARAAFPEFSGLTYEAR